MITAIKFGKFLCCLALAFAIPVSQTAGGNRVAVYGKNPESLANRIYLALLTRVDGSIRYGVDSSVPFLEPLDNPEDARKTLQELLAADKETLNLSNLEQAFLLHDVWTAFDIAIDRDDELIPLLAKVIDKLRLNRSVISKLPDNYSDAVRSKVFPSHIASDRSSAFLPPDLFEPTGAWVQIGAAGAGPIAPLHVDLTAGRSAFLLFVKCPGGRQATLKYLNQLNLYLTPWILAPAKIATRFGVTEEAIRMDPLRLNPGTPQLPDGTMFALVRRMMLIDDDRSLVATQITQSVQLRIYKSDPGLDPSQSGDSTNHAQRVFEFALSRSDLFAGKRGGLRIIASDEFGQDLMQSNNMGLSRGERLRGPIVMNTCTRCHSETGILSVNSYSRLMSKQPTSNPQLLVARDPNYQSIAAIEVKLRRFDWGLLKGLMLPLSRGEQERSRVEFCSELGDKCSNR